MKPKKPKSDIDLLSFAERQIYNDGEKQKIFGQSKKQRTRQTQKKTETGKNQ